MKLLACSTAADISYYPILRSLTVAAIHPSHKPYPSTYVLKQAILQNKCDAVIVTCQETLAVILKAQVDYVDNGKPTLDDYAGSLLSLTGLDGREIDILILNPLEHLRTVSYAKFLFKRYLSKLTSPQDWLPEVDFKWKLISKVEEVDELIVRWSSADLLSVDIETQVGCPDRSINIVGFTALWVNNLRTESVVIKFEEPWEYAQVSRLLNTSTPKLFQNGIYDNLYFLRWGITPRNWRYDTHILFHAWLAELPKRLDFIGSFTVRRVRYWKQESGGNLQDYFRYCARDTWVTALGWVSLIRDCPQWALTNYLINFPKVFLSITVGLEGLPISVERLQKVKLEKEAEAEKELITLRTWLNNKDFNPNSPLQVKTLFKILGCGHLPDTAAASMQRARAMHPINDLVLGKLITYKKAKKLISTYLVPEKFWQERLYYQLVVAATDTNRRASKESSFWCGLQLQNIPRGDSVKQFIKADDGYLLYEFDKSNAESRATAHLANEPAMIEATEGIDDYHSKNASRFFAIPYEEIFDNAKRKQLNKPLRDLSKRVNHGSNYQMGANVMLLTMGPAYVANARKLLGLDSLSLLETCEELLRGFEKTYPRIRKEWVEELVREITLTGRLTSKLGWTRQFFGDMNVKTNRNAAVAHGPQNLSVAILDEEIFQIWYATIYNYNYKIANFKIAYDFNSTTQQRQAQLTKKTYNLRGKIRAKMQIHDSFMFQCKIGEEAAIESINEIMNNTLIINNRPMYIPHDPSNGGVFWSDIK
jgi:DNA polymerase I-like protein with 3'-5' exonuclease and polymerase domains